MLVSWFAHLALQHLLRSVDGQLLERIDREQDGSSTRVDVVARVADAEVVEQCCLVELGEFHHVRGS